MIPTSLVAAVVIVVAVMPGSMYIWAFERQASAFGVTFADRTLRFIAISLLYHLLLGWPEFELYVHAFSGPRFGSGQFAAAWAAALLAVALPATLGTLWGGLYSTRNSRDGWKWARKWLTPERERRLLSAALGRTPAPRAWDDLFSDRPNVYLRIRTVDGTWLAGSFADQSYAGGYPHEGDLLLEEAWEISSEDGTLGERGLGYSVYVPAGQIGWVDVVYPSSDDGKVGLDV